VTVHFAANLLLAPGDALASYNVRYLFDPATLEFVDTVSAAAGAFPPDVMNLDSLAQGVLRFAGLNTSGVPGAFDLLRARFRSVAAGAGSTQLQVLEASGPAPALTDLISRVTTINGLVTVRP
jgi:hypothetical protein